MSSSQRRRSAPSSGSGRGAGPPTVSSTSSSSSSSSSAARRAALRAPKKRRYVDLDNTCRNPFCGAALANKTLRYCDGNKFCQLRRGIELLCAWPHAPLDDRANGTNTNTNDDDDDAPLARSVGSSRSTTSSTAGEKRPRSSDEPPTTTTAAASKKPRPLQRHASAESISASPSPSAAYPASAPTTPTAAAATGSTTAQQVKSTMIDVVPLGVGNRLGGGGRYVRSGNNRAEINTSAMVRPPSFSRFPTTTSASSGPAAASDPPPPHSNAPSLSSASGPPPTHPPYAPVSSSSSVSSAPPPPSRTLSRANSLPVTTTNRSRDPRVHAAAATGAATGDASATPARKTMSAADYLNMNRNKDASAASGSGGTTPASTSHSTTASARPPEQHRALDRSSASSSTLRVAPPPSTVDHNGSHTHGLDANTHQLRRAQSDTTAHTTPYNATKSDRYLSFRQEGYTQDTKHSSRSSADWPRPRDDYGYEQRHSYNDYGYHQSSGMSHNGNDSRFRNSYGLSITSNSNSHHDESRSYYPNASDGYDRKPAEHDLRGSSMGTMPHLSDQGDSSAHTTRESDLVHSNRNSPPRATRIDSLFASLLRPKFSHSDPFLQLILTRMASFLPEERVGIKAVTYKTTTKRKLQFYLDYAKRVEECCGHLAKLTVNDGVARLTIAGREWVAIEGTSTMVLYQQILERLHDESVRWRSLIEELKELHNTERRTRPGGAIEGVSFLKVWTAMKTRNARDASDLDFQSSFTKGNNRFHWVFIVGNVEIGSGSAVGKVDAFKDATSSAFAFIDGLMIVAPEEKNRVAHVDSSGRSNSSRPLSSSSARPGSGDSASRHAKVSTSISSSSRPSASPRTNGSAAARSSTTTSSSSPASSAVTSSRTNGGSNSSSAGRDNASTTTRNSTSATTAASSNSSDRGNIISATEDTHGGAQSGRHPPAQSRTKERIVDTPSAAGEIARERRDSWSEPQELDAAFSPVVPSERSVSDDDDRMSISSTDEGRVLSQLGRGYSTSKHLDTCHGGFVALSSKARASANIPVTPSTVASTSVPGSANVAAPATAVAVSAPASAPPAASPATPVCRFCKNLQKSKPGAVCFKHMRQPRVDP